LPELIASGKAGRPIRIATIEETEREIEATFKLGGRFIALCEPEYPMLLRRTDSAPPLIAVRGNLLSLQRSKIAVIGARNASASGLALAAQLFTRLSTKTCSSKYSSKEPRSAKCLSAGRRGDAIFRAGTALLRG
jgi:predicted Rossmann fold nucleotide-binding protein DprA/Smf involved in DNA uptake